MADKRSEWLNELNGLETRWFGFIEKLDNRMQELADAAIPELRGMFLNDKGSYYPMLSGLMGQLRGISQKANEVYDTQIEPFCEKSEDKFEEDEKIIEILMNFQEKCTDSLEEFENRVEVWIEKLNATEGRDLEARYQAIVDEYDQIKDKFRCKQCGSSIAITQMYFITTHLDCPSCQTQNTFEPSSRARELDFIGQDLAEERTRHLLDAYEAEKALEDTLYLQIHELECQSETTGTLTAINELEQKRKNAIRRAPELYKTYLKAKFDEWVKLVPELEEQNRRIYERWLKEVS